ncbi:Alpha/beta hydrolase family protein [Frankineae bacterium MT45]|nr:Alpha/beta hydrolase family protein [Frankineae bacterium MT45]
MPKFILVPGACHGGWWYDPLVDALAAAGHEARAVTLAGLDPEPKLDQLITLQTHVDQVGQVVAEFAADQGAAGVVLVGHSYAGSIITAVADQAPTAVRALVYLDAFIPRDGDSCWTMTNDEQRRWYIDGSARTGYGVDPLPFFDERARPHPLATLVQACALTGAWQQVPVKVHVEAMAWPGESPMAGAAERARADATFLTHQWQTRHNVLASGPGPVLDLLTSLQLPDV